MRVVRLSHSVFTLALALIVGGGVALIGWQSGLTGWPGLLAGVLVLWRGFRRPMRRWRVLRTGFPNDWRNWLSSNVAIYRQLAPEGRRQFEGDVRFVMAEWLFEGVEGVEVTDELRLAVAAGVATLLHGRPEWEVAPPRTILFYPEQFDEQYYADETGNYDGMAHAQGPVILSRPAVERAWQQGERGHNVVLHELAHLFDFANTYADGVSSFLDPASVEAWQQLVRRETHRIRFGRSLLRSYAAKDGAEFFAVAVENFFGRPSALAHHHPELYEALVQLLRLDPRASEEADS